MDLLRGATLVDCKVQSTQSDTGWSIDTTDIRSRDNGGTVPAPLTTLWMSGSGRNSRIHSTSFEIPASHLPPVL